MHTIQSVIESANRHLGASYATTKSRAAALAIVAADPGDILFDAPALGLRGQSVGLRRGDDGLVYACFRFDADGSIAYTVVPDTGTIPTLEEMEARHEARRQRAVEEEGFLRELDR